MEDLIKDFQLILIKYKYYDEIEPKLSFHECIQFETFRELLEKKKINNLKIFLETYGYENIINKIKSIINLTDDELKNLESKLNYIRLV